MMLSNCSSDSSVKLLTFKSILLLSPYFLGARRAATHFNASIATLSAAADSGVTVSARVMILDSKRSAAASRARA
jgi:hypothetical protein